MGGDVLRRRAMIYLHCTAATLTHPHWHLASGRFATRRSAVRAQEEKEDVMMMQVIGEPQAPGTRIPRRSCILVLVLDTAGLHGIPGRQTAALASRAGERSSSGQIEPASTFFSDVQSVEKKPARLSRSETHWQEPYDKTSVTREVAVRQTRSLL